MNLVFLSPHFPPDFYRFCVRLREAGANVLGIADQDYDQLRPELRASLTDYVKVCDMHNYDELVRSLGYFTYKFGKIDRVESHNEYWLATEARLRTDFNLTGFKNDQIDRIKRKSVMKRLFQAAGLTPARGKVCKNFDEVYELAGEVGYPLVAKPDIGVGASSTFRISNEQELAAFMQNHLPVDYIFEEFIDGQIVTFDGLADAAGDPVFSTSLRYSRGVMDVVIEDSDIYYWSVRELEPELEKAGLATLKMFDVRERFFHFEFFLTESSQLIPLEVNIRPPGGLTIDMTNYTFDFDCYSLWVDLICKGKNERITNPPYFVNYIGRKDRIAYQMSHEEVLHRFEPMIVQQERIMDIFSRALGNHGYILRHSELAPLLDAAQAIQERAHH